MAVDTPVKDTSGGGGSGGGGGASGQEKTLKVHPLAIIGISDHHTRVMTGGSALPPNSPVVGLLFGYQEGLVVSILDAEEMEPFLPHETDSARAAHLETIRTKITLHQKVFPRHEVIGWYRVATTASTEEEEEDGEVLPTAEDLRMNGNEMREYNESPLFVLMNGCPTKKKDGEKNKNVQGQDAREKLDRDERLPLAVYETLLTTTTDGGGESQQQPVFVNLEFELTTSEPERIAVEKVFKTQPPPSAAAATATVTKDDTVMATEDTTNLKKDTDEKDPESTTTETPSSSTQSQAPPSNLDMNLSNIQSTINSMNVRIAILLDFLHKTQTKEIPINHSLLRQVDGLVRQLPFVLGSGGSASSFTREFHDEYKEMMMVSYLASVAKAAKSVQIYSDKFRVLNENRRGI